MGTIFSFNGFLNRLSTCSVVVHNALTANISDVKTTLSQGTLTYPREPDHTAKKDVLSRESLQPSALSCSGQ